MTMTMTRIEKLNEVQNRAVAALEDNNFKGCVMSAPGTGKTFIFIKALYRMLELGLISRRAKVVFLAETIVREKTVWEDEIPKYNSIYKVNVLSDFDISFHCYQAKPDILYNDFENVDVVVCDEVHDAISEKYHTVLSNNKCRYIIALTGAMAMESNVFPSRIPEGMLNEVSQSEVATKARSVTDFVTKGQVLEMFCPVVFVYTTAQAIEDGVISRFKTYEILHELDNTNKSIQTWKSYPTLGTEYDYYSKRDAIRRDFRQSSFRKMAVAREMSRFLYKLPSKVNVAKAILARLGNQKTLVFGIEKEALYKITPNVVEPDNFNELIDKFNKGDIKVIASAKMLKQGITLNGVQNIIFHSYDSKWHNMEQKRARIRWLDGEFSKLFFIVTQGTYEEKWYSNLRKQKDAEGKIIKIHDLNVTSVVKSSNLLKWYNNGNISKM